MSSAWELTPPSGVPVFAFKGPGLNKIPPRSLVMGMPAKTVRKLTAKELKMLREVAEEYVNLARNYKEG